MKYRRGERARSEGGIHVSGVVVACFHASRLRKLTRNPYLLSETESCVRAAFSDSGVGDAVRVKVITEPEAASLAYSVASRGRKEEVGSSSSPTEENILVFDLGGGTFDVTVVNVGYKSSGVVAGVEILATGGDRYLGGDDFDKLLASYLWEKYGGDGWNEWENFAREAKIKLSSSNKVERMVGLPVAGRGLEDFGEGDGDEVSGVI